MLVVPGTARAYSETQVDKNDTKSPLDLAQVKRTDHVARMTFEITTFKGFKAKRLDLDRGRYLLLGFDRDRKKNDRSVFERCAFIFFDTGKLRWIATDCGLNYYDQGTAKKTSNKTIKVTLNMAKLDVFDDHEWSLFSFWDGSPCGPHGCADSMPNKEPLYLREFTPPKVAFDPPTLSTAVSTSTSFPVEFKVTDPRGSGVASWELWSADFDFFVWTLSASGTSGGSKSPMFAGAEGGSYDFYILADDAQGNHTETQTQLIVVPWDDDNVPDLVTSGVTTVADPSAYGGGLTVLPDDTASMSFQGGRPGCPQLWVIGPGTGTWTIEIHKGFDLVATVDSDDIPDEPMQVFWHGNGCGQTYSITLVAGADAPIDAVGQGPIP